MAAPFELGLNEGYREISGNEPFVDEGFGYLKANIKWNYKWDGFDNDNDGLSDEAQPDNEEVFFLIPSNTSDPYTFNTDDPLWDSDSVIMPTQNVPVLRPPDQASVVEAINEFYNPLYIQCMQIDHGSNVHSITPQFRRQTAQMENNTVDVLGDEHSFWTTCVVWAYEDEHGKTVMDYRDTKDVDGDGVMDKPACAQEFYAGDDDPENEGVPRAPDALPDFAGGDVVSRHGGTDEKSGWSMIYIETIRDLSEFPLLITVAHEMAHQLGASHAPYRDQFLPDEHGIMYWDKPDDPTDLGYIPCNRMWYQDLRNPYIRSNPPDRFH